jgi:hypothetical protein
MYHLIHKLEISGLSKALTVDDFERLAPLERDFRNQKRISYQWRIVENFDDCLAQPPVHQFLDFLEANRSILSQYHSTDYTYWLTIIYCDQCAYELGLQTIKKMASLSLTICLNWSSPARFQSKSRVGNVKKIDHSAHRSQMSVKIAEQSDERKCSKSRELIAASFAPTPLSPALAVSC